MLDNCDRSTPDLNKEDELYTLLEKFVGKFDTLFFTMLKF